MHVLSYHLLWNSPENIHTESLSFVSIFLLNISEVFYPCYQQRSTMSRRTLNRTLSLDCCAPSKDMHLSITLPRCTLVCVHQWQMYSWEAAPVVKRPQRHTSTMMTKVRISREFEPSSKILMIVMNLSTLWHDFLLCMVLLSRSQTPVSSFEVLF